MNGNRQVPVGLDFCVVVDVGSDFEFGCLFDAYVDVGTGFDADIGVGFEVGFDVGFNINFGIAADVGVGVGFDIGLESVLCRLCYENHKKNSESET